MVSYFGVFSSGAWSLIKVVFHQVHGLIRVVSYQVVFDEGGLLSKWSLIRWFFISVVFHQGGLL